MATSSILGGEHAPSISRGRDTDALGPSDSSDSGSDVQGERINATTGDDESTSGSLPVELGSDSDSAGTGERASAAPGTEANSADILPDRIETRGEDALDGKPVSIDDAESDSVEELAVEDDDEPEAPDQQ